MIVGGQAVNLWALKRAGLIDVDGATLPKQSGKIGSELNFSHSVALIWPK